VNSTTATYDALGRPLTAATPGETPIAYTYDAGSYGIGHLTGMTDPSGSTAWTYNVNGETLTKTQVASGVSLTATWQHNPYCEQPTYLTYPSARYASYTYDNAKRLSMIYVSSVGYPAGSVAYEPFGCADYLRAGGGAGCILEFEPDVQVLRAAGIAAEVYLGASGMKAQMKYADRRLSPAAIMMPPNATATITGHRARRRCRRSSRYRLLWR